MADKIGQCNQALAEIFAQPIASIDEPSLEARECRRVYDDVVAEMLALHDWSFSIKRAVLASVANDRASEWGYAYAIPTDAATIRSLMAPSAAAVWPVVVPPLIGERPFIVDGERIYSVIGSATAEYTVSAISPTLMPPPFSRALVLELASRIVVPVKKDAKRQGELIRMAEVAKQRAMADDMNRQPQADGTYISDVMLARDGWYP